jgi:peroxygenase
MGGGGDKYREVKKKDDKMDSGTRMTPSSTLIQTSLPDHPEMAERPAYVPGPGDPLTEAGVARANIAPDREHPLGTTVEGWAERHKEQSVMQQHCEYFDPDHDGVIWPRDTYNGCRNFGIPSPSPPQWPSQNNLTDHALSGWGIPLSLFATFIIHLNLSYPTVPGKIPDPFFRIWYANAYRLKHGSDSMTYDFEGRYRPQFFEEIFTRYDRDNKGGLTFRDVLRMWNGQKMVFDFYGWCATFLECKALSRLVSSDRS